MIPDYLPAWDFVLSMTLLLSPIPTFFIWLYWPRKG